MTKPPPSPQADEPPANEAELSRSRLEVAIRDGVIAALGRPPGLYQVAVRRLWSSHYRVNVLVGVDPTPVRVAHSFFVEVGEGGRIAQSTPPVTRLYG